MADVFDKKTRSRIMRTVRTSLTEPEERLAVALKASGLNFCRNDARIFGTPDLAFRRVRLAVFVDGDFWHGRAWFQDGTAPATNADSWVGKFERNRLHDRQVDQTLRRGGWSVLRLWASEILKNPAASAGKVRTRLRLVERKTHRAKPRRRHRSKP
jgi:DNA mismatch endonuclease Vsr